GGRVSGARRRPARPFPGRARLHALGSGLPPRLGPGHDAAGRPTGPAGAPGRMSIAGPMTRRYDAFTAQATQTRPDAAPAPLRFTRAEDYRMAEGGHTQ